MSTDDQTPATKGDLNRLETRILTHVHSEMGTLHANIRTEMETMRASLVDQMRDMQTELLKAFYNWARPFEIKLRTLPQMDERLGLLEERVSELERRGGPAT